MLINENIFFILINIFELKFMNLLIKNAPMRQNRKINSKLIFLFTKQMKIALPQFLFILDLNILHI